MEKKARQVARPSRTTTSTGLKSATTSRTVEFSAPSNGQAIVRTRGICGGNPRIAGTRIPVWLLAFEKRLGIAESKILKRHPRLSRDALRNALKYAVDHFAEIEEQIRKNEGR